MPHRTLPSLACGRLRPSLTGVGTCSKYLSWRIVLFRDKAVLTAKQHATIFPPSSKSLEKRLSSFSQARTLAETFVHGGTAAVGRRRSSNGARHEALPRLARK